MSYLVKRKTHKANTVINQTASALSLDPKLVESVVQHHYTYFINFINNPHKPAIFMPGLGRFVIYPKGMEAFRAGIRRIKYKEHEKEKQLSQLLRIFRIRHKIMDYNKRIHKVLWQKKKAYLTPPE